MHNNAVSFHAPAKQSLRKRVCQRWQLFLFLLIPVAWVLIFCYYPMMGVQIAFKNYLPREGIWGSAWVGLTHFVTFFKSFYFSRTVGNTVRLSLYSLGVGFPLAIIFALMMNLIRRRRFQKAVQTISYMPHFISTVVLVGMMNQILNPSHRAVQQHLPPVQPRRIPHRYPFPRQCLRSPVRLVRRLAEPGLEHHHLYGGAFRRGSRAA